VGRIYFETHIFPLLRIQRFCEEIALDLRVLDGGRLPSLLNAHLTPAPARGQPRIHIAVMEPRERRRYEQELLSTKRALEARNLEFEHANAQLNHHRDHLQQMVEERTRTIQTQADELAQALKFQQDLNEQQIQFVRTV
jgi:sigma-B regulation protein RsbU (phosphoserine phosphatase)